jgi:hypothetical protein
MRTLNQRFLGSLREMPAVAASSLRQRAMGVDPHQGAGADPGTMTDGTRFGGVSNMDVIIRDAMFCRHTVIEIRPGQDRVVFERCVFEGGYVFVDEAIDCTTFVACSFHGTSFTGQALSPRIARECHWQPAPTEDAVPRHRFMDSGPSLAEVAGVSQTAANEDAAAER